MKPLHLVDTTLFYSPTSGGVRRYLNAKHAWLAAHTHWEHTLVVPGRRSRVERGGVCTLAGFTVPGTFNYRLPLNFRRWTRLLWRGNIPPPMPAPAVPTETPVETPSTNGERIRALKSFEDLIGLAAEKRDLSIKSALERDVRLVRFEDGTLEIALEAGAHKTLIGELSKKLAEWTGRRWMVAVSAETGSPSLRAQAEMRKAEMKDGVRGDPLVQAVMERFPGAEIVDVRPPAGPAPRQPSETSPGSQPDDKVADDDTL